MFLTNVFVQKYPNFSMFVIKLGKFTEKYTKYARYA